MSINHIYTVCLNRKRPRHEQGIINVLHPSAGSVVKCVISSPPITQTRLEVEMRGNSACASSLSQTPSSPFGKV